jgi:coenzyme F420 biosynthesis associated uncharacterized protein
VRRGFRRGLALGAVYGLLAVMVAEAVRPRGGSAALLDWEEVSRLALGRLRDERVGGLRLADAAAAYNRFAAELRGPLLEAVGGLPAGVTLPDFEALDRARWLEVNVAILRRVMEPLATATRVPETWLSMAGRAGLNRYVALMLEFLSRRVLGQFDPQLMGSEQAQPALYLVEPNVAAWERQAGLPGDDLRRWLILHEMTHAWQFAAHPWLRAHLDGRVQELVGLTSRSAASRGIERLRALTVGVPSQWDLVRRLQATMSLIEGHGNLVMNLVGGRLLPSFEQLQAAYRARSSERGMLEQLILRVTGLEMKLEQYRVGERFARAIHERHGMEALNRAWEGPESLPGPDELADPERWYRRVARGGRPPGDAG